MRYLRIISFHNSTRQVINNACTAANSKVLLPCVAGNLANCRPPDVRFVSLQLELDFAPVSPDADDGTISKAMYYLELPQMNVDLENGVAVVRSLVNFHGTADLRTLSGSNLWTETLKRGPYNSPINLSIAHNFPTGATIDGEVIVENMTKKIFCMGFNPTLKALLNQPCHNYSDKLQDNVEQVSMSIIDPGRNNIVLRVNSYNVRFWSDIRPFMFEE